MTRTLTSAMKTAIGGDQAECCFLFEFESSGGTTRLTTAGGDIDWNSQTWSSYAALSFGAVQETPEPEDQQVKITIDACDTAILAEILDEDYIGRLARIYLAHLIASGRWPDSSRNKWNSRRTGLSSATSSANQLLRSPRPRAVSRRRSAFQSTAATGLSAGRERAVLRAWL